MRYKTVCLDLRRKYMYDTFILIKAINFYIVCVLYLTANVIIAFIC